MAADILIVDDEADIRELISGILQDEGYETRLARNSDAALAALADRRPSLIVLDIWLQDSKLDGLDLLTVIRERHPELPVVIISGHGNIETAVSAIKRGAYDYIEKPFNADRLLLVVGRALEATRLRRENEALKGRTGADVEVLGSSMIHGLDATEGDRHVAHLDEWYRSRRGCIIAHLALTSHASDRLGRAIRP